jgi:hypothetical protein
MVQLKIVTLCRTHKKSTTALVCPTATATTGTRDEACRIREIPMQSRFRGASADAALATLEAWFAGNRSVAIAVVGCPGGRERMRSSANACLPRYGNPALGPRAMSWERRTLATCDRALPARVKGRCWITPIRVTPTCWPLRTNRSHLGRGADMAARWQMRSRPLGGGGQIGRGARTRKHKRATRCDPRQKHKRTERSRAELRSRPRRRRSARSELGGSSHAFPTATHPFVAVTIVRSRPSPARRRRPAPRDRRRAGAAGSHQMR